MIRVFGTFNGSLEGRIRSILWKYPFLIVVKRTFIPCLARRLVVSLCSLCNVDCLAFIIP